MPLELVGRFGLSGLPYRDVSHALVDQLVVDVILDAEVFEEQTDQMNV